MLILPQGVIASYAYRLAVSTCMARVPLRFEWSR